MDILPYIVIGLFVVFMLMRMRPAKGVRNITTTQLKEELKDIFAATDFVLSRAGSNAIFEFLALRIPMLLIPLSREASRGDQIINAKSFQDKNYARVLEEEDLSEETLKKELEKLVQQRPIILDKMKTYQSEKSRDRVVEIIKESAK